MRLISSFAAVTAILAATATEPAAQRSPLQSQLRPFTIDSGVHNNPTSTAREVFRRLVHVNLVPWMRLVVDKSSLPAGSRIEVVAVEDGHRHVLDAAELASWHNRSAYFNGDMLLVSLIAGARTTGVFFKSSVVEAGLPGAVGPTSQCGPTDDRVPSTDKRTGRLLPSGCTAWLISSVNCFITAGHCRSSGSMTVQYNVPPSSSSGQIRHPGPQDQYSVDMTTVTGNTGGIGNDWAVFKTVKNGTTGRHAGQVQGAHFTVAFVKPPLQRQTRITGYGVDRDQRTRSQTNQTHVGPMRTNSGTRLCYTTDTEGGNSGSPVIDDVTGNAVGVHTHGGCSSVGCNSGTSTTLTAFGNAVRSLTCDPPLCNNTATFKTYGVSCKTSRQKCALRYSQNWLQTLAGKTTTATQIGILDYGRPESNICQVDLYTRSRSGTVNVKVSIADFDSSTGKPGQIRGSGTVTVGPTAGVYSATISPLVLRRFNETFIVQFDNADKIVLPATSTGETRPHYEWRNNAWGALQFDTKFQYRVHHEAGALTPTLTNTDTPVLGKSFTVDLSQAPSSRATLLFFGFSNTKWGALPLPFDLKNIGAPGCTLLAAGHIIFATVTDSTGKASSKFALPKDKNLCNAHTYFQYVVLDLLANQLGLVFTNGGDAHFGS